MSVTGHDGAFPRSARLTRSGDFRAVFAGAERHADRYVTILVGAGRGTRPRLGLAISKRVAPRAVDRNRIKRLIRESFRRNQHRLPVIDAVVMVRPIARHTESATLSAALDRLWQRISRQCEPS